MHWTPGLSEDDTGYMGTVNRRRSLPGSARNERLDVRDICAFKTGMGTIHRPVEHRDTYV